MWGRNVGRVAIQPARTLLAFDKPFGVTCPIFVHIGDGYQSSGREDDPGRDDELPAAQARSNQASPWPPCARLGPPQTCRLGDVACSPPALEVAQWSAFPRSAQPTASGSSRGGPLVVGDAGNNHRGRPLRGHKQFQENLCAVTAACAVAPWLMLRSVLDFSTGAARTPCRDDLMALKPTRST
jgi:hypothetical protein